jgi:hypothetical protein
MLAVLPDRPLIIGSGLLTSMASPFIVDPSAVHPEVTYAFHTSGSGVRLSEKQRRKRQVQEQNQQKLLRLVLLIGIVPMLLVYLLISWTGARDMYHLTTGRRGRGKCDTG